MIRSTFSRLPVPPRSSAAGARPLQGAPGDVGEQSAHGEPEVSFELVGADASRLRVDGRALVFPETLFSTRARTSVPRKRTEQGRDGTEGALIVTLPELGAERLSAFRAAIVGEGLPALDAPGLLAVAVAADRELVEPVRDEAIRRLATDTDWIADCHPEALGPADCAILEHVRGMIERPRSKAILDAIIGIAEGDPARTAGAITTIRSTRTESLPHALHDLAQVRLLGDRALVDLVRSEVRNQLTWAAREEACDVLAAAVAAGDKDLASMARAHFLRRCPASLVPAFDALERALELDDAAMIEAARQIVKSWQTGSTTDYEVLFARAMRRGETRILELVRPHLLERPPLNRAAALARLDAVAGDPLLVEETCARLVELAFERDEGPAASRDCSTDACLRRVFEHPELPLAKKLAHLAVLGLAMVALGSAGGLCVAGGAGVLAGLGAAITVGGTSAAAAGALAAIAAGTAVAVPAVAVGGAGGLCLTGGVSVLAGLTAATTAGCTSAAAAGALAAIAVGTSVAVPAVPVGATGAGVLVVILGTAFGVPLAQREARRGIATARHQGARLFDEGTRALSETSRVLGDAPRALGDAPRALGDATYRLTNRGQRESTRLLGEAAALSGDLFDRVGRQAAGLPQLLSRGPRWEMRLPWTHG